MENMIKQVQTTLMALVQGQVNGNIDCVDAKELGEVVDMVKDLAETCYYTKITEAMEKNSDKDNDMYIDKYLYTSPTMRGGRRMYHDDMMMSTDMYYPGLSRNYGNIGESINRRDINTQRDYREGRSPMMRKTYMEMKESNADKDKKMHGLDEYMRELSSDITEMINDATPEEKGSLKNKLVALANKL